MQEIFNEKITQLRSTDGSKTLQNVDTVSSHTRRTLTTIPMPSQAHAAPELLAGILGNQGDHGVRCNTDVKSWKPCVESQWATSRHGLRCTVKRALVHQLTSDWIWLLLLHLRLDKVERQGEEGCEEACNCRSTENKRCTSDAHVRKHVLTRRIEGKHPEVQRHGPGHCRHCSVHKTCWTLVFDDETERSENIGVASAFSCWFHAVCLHTNEGQVSRVANERC